MEYEETYLEFISNKINNKLTENESEILFLRLCKILAKNSIKIEIQSDPTESFPYLCVLLQDNNLIGQTESNGSKLLIDLLKQISRNDLAERLIEYDQHMLNISYSSSDSETMSNSSSFVSFLGLNSQNTISRWSSISSVQNEETNSIQIKNEPLETFSTRVFDEIVELHFKPYSFQLNLAINSCNRLNNIICVRTGSGKTLIAALICKYWFTKSKKENTLNKFKCVFLVPTRNLVHQQAETFKKAFDANLIQEIDEKANENKLRDLFDLNSKNVFLMTPQKLMNALDKETLNINKISLLIFDECHHTYDNHPYNKIMEVYFSEKLRKVKLPLIIGLSASLGTDGNSAMSQIFTLCANMDCKNVSYVNTEDDRIELADKIPSPLEDKLITIIPTQNLKNLLEQTKLVSCQIMKLAKISENGDMIGEPTYETFLYKTKLDAEKFKIRVKIIACQYLIELHLFYLRVQDFPTNYCYEKLNKFLDKFNTLKDPEPIQKQCRDILQKFVDYIKANLNDLKINAKLEKLVELIITSHKPNSKGLCLVRTRHHVKAIRNFLNDHPSLKEKNIKPDILLGANSSAVDEISMSLYQQNESIKKFRLGLYNLLVATDIAQEGLDIPECNYVIRYEFVSNEIGTIQSRGRARAEKGQTFLITEKNSLNQKRELENRQKEMTMEKALSEYAKMSKEQFNIQFREFSSKVENNLNLCLRKMSIAPHSNETLNLCNPKSVTIICRDCNKNICNCDDIKYREPNYISESNVLASRVKLLDKKFYCLNESCNKELGKLMEIRNSTPLYILDIKGIKFEFPRTGVEIISKWSKVQQKVSIKNY